MTKRTTRFLTVLAVILCWTAVLSFFSMRSHRAAALTARGDLETCTLLAEKIQALSRRPSLALERERHAAETSGLIERAAGAAGLPPGSLLRITPGPPQRIEDTVYKEKPLRIVIKKAQLQQLTQFMCQLSAGDQGLQTRSLRLRAAQQQDGAVEAWDAEIVVAYLIYDPPHVGPVEK